MPSTFIQQRNKAFKKYNPEESFYQNSKITKKSPSTLHRWSKVDMSTHAQQSRLNNRGRRRILTENEEGSILTWIRERAEKGTVTLGKDIINYIIILTQGQWKPTKGDISKLCKQLDISSKTQKKRNSKQMRSTYESEIANFHTKIKELNLKPSE